MDKPSHDRAQELAYRRKRLQAQCAIQRRDLGAAAAHVEFQLSGVDKAVLLVRRVTSAPALVSAGIAVLTLVGPKRALRWVSQGAFWYTSGKRMLGLVNSHPAFSHTFQSLMAAVESKVASKAASVRVSSVRAQPPIAAPRQ
jgi:hypothetical protein